jgi:hypothetical protein
LKANANEKRTKLKPPGLGFERDGLLVARVGLDGNLLLVPPHVAQICTIDRAQHVSLGFISNREENGDLGPIRLGERELTVPDSTGVVSRVHGKYSKRNITLVAGGGGQEVVACDAEW